MGWKKFLKSITKKQANIFNEAEEYFIRSGFTIPIHGHGNESATLTLASDDNQRYFSNQINEHRHEIHIISLYYHQKIKEIYLCKKEKFSP